MGFEVRISGSGFPYDEQWLKCEASQSKKDDLALVKVQVQDSVEPALFFVSSSLVEPNVLPTDGVFTPGRVKSALIEMHNGTAIVEIPGEAVSYGPKVFVSKDLLG